MLNLSFFLMEGRRLLDGEEKEGMGFEFNENGN